MEVHHPHGGHHQRRWVDYLFEFIMLFFAVSAGFFVENIREGYVEHHREKQYIESLVDDIKTDTTEIGEISRGFKDQLKGMDSLLKVIENPDKKNLINKLYYFSFKYLNGVAFFDHVDRTISQLKNAGGLRLIRETGASDSIVSYYSSVANVEYNSNFNMKGFERLLTLEKEMFDFRILRKIDDNQKFNLYLILSKNDLELLDKDPRVVNHFYNELLLYASGIGNYNNLLKGLNIQAKTLLVFLEKKYNLH